MTIYEYITSSCSHFVSKIIKLQAVLKKSGFWEFYKFCFVETFAAITSWGMNCSFYNFSVTPCIFVVLIYVPSPVEVNCTFCMNSNLERRRFRWSKSKSNRPNNTSKLQKFVVDALSTYWGQYNLVYWQWRSL